jgi:exodeoxyribonuclease-3
MRIVTYNINGIRSAIKKGFLDWMKAENPDVICLQEIKAEKDNVDFAAIEALGYDTYWFSAEKKGYSGVAVFTKRRPDAVFYGNGIMQSDAEGRVLRADFGDVTLINAYFPSGTTGELRQTYKYQWLDEFFEYLGELRKTRPKLIIVGDYNIAHKEIDIHNPKGNKKTSGFLPEERAWMDKFYENDYVDTFRCFNQEPHHYTWWSARFPSVREQNKGWRIDYISVTEPLRGSLKGAGILLDVKHSDHCPSWVDIDIQ